MECIETGRLEATDAARGKLGVLPGCGSIGNEKSGLGIISILGAPLPKVTEPMLSMLPLAR